MIELEDVLRSPSSGAHPWYDAEYSFAGWVPCVSGHLSFNQVDPHGRQSTFNHQGDLGQARTVVSHHARIVQDYPFWNWLVRMFRPQASQDFVLVAESGEARTPYIRDGKVDEVDDEHGALRGILAVLPNDDEPTARSEREALINHIDATIADAIARRADGAIAADERLAPDLVTRLDATRPAVAAYLMRFALFRTGECRIWFDMREFLGRDVEGEPPTEGEIVAAEKLPAQAYYFVKDLLHTHYHHEPSSDQILPLTRLSGGGGDEQVLKDEIRWRYVSLRGLVRVVVELRKGRSLQGHKRALGIIAYANAFQAVLGRAIRRRSGQPAFADDGGLILYEFANLEKSIEATDSSLESVTTSRLQLFAIEVGILLSALALWAGAVQIQPILCGSKEISCPKVGPGPIVSIVNDIVANPLGFISLLLAIGFLLFIVFFRGTGAIPYAERFVRWIKSLADALATSVSKLTRNSDGLGWTVALILLAVVTAGAVRLAYHLVPKKHVPPVEVQRPPAGPWSSLQAYVDKPVTTSGLLVSSVVASDLRNMLGADYFDHVRAMEGATLRRSGDIFFAVSPPRSNGDGGYILLDAGSRRIEATMRKDGHSHPHRSPGAEIPRPPEVRAFLGATAGADAEPVPVAAPKCDIVQGGTDGSTLQLSGALRPDAYCSYRIPLQAGQSLSFAPARAKGLYVAAVEGSSAKPVDSSFRAIRNGTQVIRIGWAGWRPEESERLRARPFYIRLNVR